MSSADPTVCGSPPPLALLTLARLHTDYTSQQVKPLAPAPPPPHPPHRACLLSALPWDLQLRFTESLDTESLLSLGQVCSFFCELCAVDAVWESALRRDFESLTLGGAELLEVIIRVVREETREGDAHL